MVAKSKKTVKKPKAKDALKWLESAAATADGRPSLTAGHVSNGAAIAADGFRMHIVWGDAIPHENSWITFKKTVSGATKYTFPNAWAIIPAKDTETETAIVSVSELAQAVKIARVFAKANGDKVSLTFMSGRVYVTGSDPIDGNAQTAIQALTDRPNDQRSDFAVKGEYLIDALAGFSEHVTLRLYGNNNDALTLGEHGDRLALLMPMSERDPKIDTRPSIDDTLEARPFEPGASVKPPAAPKVKPVKVAKAEETETVTTDAAGMVHERVEYRRGAAAFADIQSRLTPEKIAEFQRIMALKPFEQALTRALQRSKVIHGAATIGYRTARRAILIACENDDYERRCYALHLRGDEAQLISYRKQHDSPVETKTEATISLHYLGDAWGYVQALAANYGYTPVPAPAVASAAV